ncbi:hypothetical protein ABH962_003189 [Bacillus sp. RC54]
MYVVQHSTYGNTLFGCVWCIVCVVHGWYVVCVHVMCVYDDTKRIEQRVPFDVLLSDIWDVVYRPFPGAYAMPFSHAFRNLEPQHPPPRGVRGCIGPIRPLNNFFIIFGTLPLSDNHVLVIIRKYMKQCSS